MALIFPSTIIGTFTTGTVVTTVTPNTTATGGNYFFTTSSGYFPGTSYVHVFTTTGTLTVSSAIPTAAFLLAAGGGGGGAGLSNPWDGGGGGAGGVVTGTTFLAVGAYTVGIGRGGPGGVYPSPTGIGTNGGSSTVTGPGLVLTSIGGGGGGGGGPTPSPGSYPGNPGGSGGGGGAGLTSGCSPGLQPGQSQTVTAGSYVNSGFPGSHSNGPSNRSGGGGGAGAKGNCFLAGCGIFPAITGQAISYAYGGAGTSTASPGGAATTNPYGASGSGGGGGGAVSSGLAGSPGIFVVTYPTCSSKVTLTNQETWIYCSAHTRWVVSQTTTASTSLSVADYSGQADTATGAFALPTGSTAQRPTTATNGYLRYNTDIGMVETYFTATGWTVNFGNTQTVYTAQYLAVGGGGGGGQAGAGIPSPGGNGASGAVAQGFVNLVQGTAYSVTVGQGGAANSVPQACRNAGGATGGSSTMIGVNTFGTFFQANGGTGGGGGGNPFTGSPGTCGTAPIGGSPVAVPGGVYSSITGSTVQYGKAYPAPGLYGAGGGGGAPANGNGTPGTPGVVLIKYPGSQRATGGNSITTVGTYTLHTFTTPGTFSA